MDKEEIEYELVESYRGLVNYLLKKYGPAPCSYFKDRSCKTVDPRISRSAEGLQCHHIDEDKAIMLSATEYAIRNPFKYQEANRLVYCNILEHLILHLKIVEQPRKKSANPGEAVGIGGAINHLIPQINDYYNGNEFAKDHQKKLMAILENNFDNYITILLQFLAAAFMDPVLERKINKNRLSRGSNKKIVDKIYKELEARSGY